jgi:septum site-determining protein MinC
MLAVGLAGEPDTVAAISMALNLPVLSTYRAGNRPVPVVQPATEAAAPQASCAPVAAVAVAAPAEVLMPALIHAQPVRSGQRVYGRNRDLIVTAAVGAGAEVMADGCLHVYGSLRGRAMAGAHGELSARIFCQEFYAELVSIAGIFRVFETIPPELAGKPVQIWLSGEDLRLARTG